MGILLLNSKGFNTRAGTCTIRTKLLELGYEDLSLKTIFAASLPAYEVDDIIVNNLTEIAGFRRENIYMSADGIHKNVAPDFIYVTEGNTFEVLNYMRQHRLIEYIREMYSTNPNTVYIGSSAGAMIAGTDIMLAGDFDSNAVGMMDYTALGLFEGTIIPHYEPEQLERYLDETQDHIKNRYKQILSVGNTEVIVMKT